MLFQAAAEPGRVHWVEADIRTWQPERPADLIYSNASLHWIDDHQKLLPRLASYLKPGGCLAAQMPLSWEAPSHRLMRETLENGSLGGKPFGSAAFRKAAARKWVLEAQEYYDRQMSLAVCNWMGCSI